MRVVEVGGEAEEREHGRELVQDQEGGNVRERRVGQAAGVFVQELGEPAVEAFDARLRRRRRGGLRCEWAMRAWP